MSLKDFGKRVRRSVANLCDIEKGRKGVSPEKAEQIAKAIGVPPALLVRLAIEESLRGAGRVQHRGHACGSRCSNIDVG